MMKYILPLLLSAVLVSASYATTITTMDGKEVKSFKIKLKLNGNYVIKDVVLVAGGTDDGTGGTDDGTGGTDDGTGGTDDGTGGTDDGTGGTEDQELVFETLNWVIQPGQRVIDIPRTDIIASRFTTTDSELYSGYITLVPVTGTGHVSRNLWISTSPGGQPLQQDYDRCNVSGSEVSLRWSQEPEPRTQIECKLATGTTYYLNYGNEGCTTSICGAFRNTRHNGEP